MSPVGRRAALAALAAVVPTAGYVDVADPVPGPASPSDVTRPPTPTDAPCPSFADADRTVCYGRDRAADPPVLLVPGDGPLVLEPGDGAVDTVGFDLRNRADRAFLIDPHAWAVERRTADGWRRVAPDGGPEPLVRLAPGDRHRWSLSAVPHPSPRGDGTTYAVADVSPGVHAFAVTGGFEGQDGRRVEAVSLFDVVRRPPA